MSSRAISRRQSGSSNGSGWQQSAGSASSGRSLSSDSSTSSDATHSHFDRRISEIRETTPEEKQKYPRKTVYILRKDSSEDYVSSVEEIVVYRMGYGASIPVRAPLKWYWSAYNTIAYFIIEGQIRLSGGRDCFKRLASPKHGVGSLRAGHGIYIQPTQNIQPFGKVEPTNPSNDYKDVHLSAERQDERGVTINAITLQRGQKYFVAGETEATSSSSRSEDILIVPRGRLREAGFEILARIHTNDLWIMNRLGGYHAVQPLIAEKTCPGCQEVLKRRQWPTAEHCKHISNNCNGLSKYIRRVKRYGCTPALAAFASEPFLITSYRSGWFFLEGDYPAAIKRVLDANFTIRDWKHLAEATDMPVELLAVVFSNVPSLGERLDMRGASFVPWAGDAGFHFGTHIRFETKFLGELYIVSEGTVIETSTGESVRLEEDQHGIIRVRRTGEGCSTKLPRGVDGYVCLG